MDISNVGAASGYQYQPKTTSNLQEEVRNTPDSETKDYSGSVVKTKTLGFFNESLAC